jgi:hypothetical protein
MYICVDHAPDLPVCIVVHHESCHVLQFKRLRDECQKKASKDERIACFIAGFKACGAYTEQQCYGHTCRLDFPDKDNCDGFVDQCKKRDAGVAGSPPVSCDIVAEPKPCACEKFVRPDDCKVGECDNPKRETCEWSSSQKHCQCVDQGVAGLPSCCGPVDCTCSGGATGQGSGGGQAGTASGVNAGGAGRGPGSGGSRPR